MTFTFADPREWWLEITPSIEAEATRQSQHCTTPDRQHTAYLNALCLQAILTRVQETVPKAQVWTNVEQLPTFWEFATGAAVLIGSTRLILMPSEAVDDGELEVPQEWVDLPSWAGDYYLAVQVQLESRWIRVWSYTTHQALKSIGTYDPIDRTYCLKAEQLTQDLNTFWVTVQFCLTEQTRAAIVPLPALPTTQAQNLLERLGDRSIIFPRLAIPFSLWGAVMEQGWRQTLYQQRRGEQSGVRLSDWLRGQWNQAWRSMDEIFPPQPLATAWRSSSASDQLYEINRVKVLEFSSQAGGEQIALLVGLTAVSDTEINIGIQLCPMRENTFLNKILVRLLDGQETEIGQASAAITETIQLQFSGQLRERFSIEITSGSRRIVEAFEI
ncbi:DUF1822 family protein [Phormidesmis sp. 146-35]